MRNKKIDVLVNSLCRKILEHILLLNGIRDSEKYTVEKTGKIIPSFTKDEDVNIYLNCVNEINESFNDICKYSGEENLFWLYCPIAVYKSHYDDRLNVFLSKNLEEDELDFISNELEIYKNKNFTSLYFKLNSYEPESQILIPDCILYLDEIQQYKAINAIKKKITFLHNKQKEFQARNEKQDSIEDELIDYSDSKAPEKFVMLYELGIIDYLKGKYPILINQSKLGSLISHITGMDAENARKMINGSINRDHNNKLTPNKKIKIKAILASLEIRLND